ncbi:hypothetical protein QS257_18785 [Terrilactibacillus sp. S3-3]|nr:hypothetical protein QS257_18785 [Terrilactibacillus sp. S3-3]
MAAAVIHVQPLPIGEVISCLQSLGMAPSFAPLSGHVETASGSEQTILADHSFTQGIDIHWHMIFQEQPVNPSIFWEQHAWWFRRTGMLKNYPTYIHFIWLALTAGKTRMPGPTSLISSN